MIQSFGAWQTCLGGTPGWSKACVVVSPPRPPARPSSGMVHRGCRHCNKPSASSTCNREFLLRFAQFLPLKMFVRSVLPVFAESSLPADASVQLSEWDVSNVLDMHESDSQREAWRKRARAYACTVRGDRSTIVRADRRPSGCSVHRSNIQRRSIDLECRKRRRHVRQCVTYRLLPKPRDAAAQKPVLHAHNQPSSHP